MLEKYSVEENIGRKYSFPSKSGFSHSEDIGGQSSAVVT